MKNTKHLILFITLNMYTFAYAKVIEKQGFINDRNHKSEIYDIDETSTQIIAETLSQTGWLQYCEVTCAWYKHGIYMGTYVVKDSCISRNNTGSCYAYKNPSCGVKAICN